MIGDDENDVKAGLAAGCKTALISSEDVSYSQDVTVADVADFVDRCLV